MSSNGSGGRWLFATFAHSPAMWSLTAAIQTRFRSIGIIRCVRRGSVWSTTFTRSGADEPARSKVLS